MYQEWIKGRSLTSTNPAELMEKEALEKERKEGNEKFDLGEQSTAGTEQMWTLVGTTLTNANQSLLQSHTFSPLCFNLPHRLMSCFWRATSFSRAEVSDQLTFHPVCSSLTYMHKALLILCQAQPVFTGQLAHTSTFKCGICLESFSQHT